MWVGDPDAEEPTYAADALIVATGAQSLMLGLPNEERLLGYGVSTCATCDGFFFRDREIAVVGGGDSALEEALFLTRFADQGHRDPPAGRAAGVEDHAGAGLRQPEDRLPSGTRWSPRCSATPRCTGRPGPQHRPARRSRTSSCSGLFVAIGHEPNTALFKGQLEMEENGYLRTFDGTRTNVDGVFACGDVQDHRYRQAITAAGSGCMAAIDAERWLDDAGRPVADPGRPSHRPQRE